MSPERANLFRGRQESVSPSASTVGADLGERLLAQRFRGFADTEEVTLRLTPRLLPSRR